MFSGNHPTTIHLNCHSSSEHCWSVWIHQGWFSFQWEHSSSSSHPNVCIGRLLVNEWQSDEKASILELCHVAERHDKQNKRLLMRKGIKESWDGLQIIFSTIIHKAAVEIQKVCHGAYLKQFWVIFFKRSKSAEGGAFQISWTKPSKHPGHFIFLKDILDAASYSLTTHTQCAKLLYMPHCALFLQGCYFHTEMKVVMGSETRE